MRQLPRPLPKIGPSHDILPDFDLGLTMGSAAETTQDTWNGHEIRPGGTRDRQAITLASHRPARREHRTLHLREDLPRMFEKESTSAR